MSLLAMNEILLVWGGWIVATLLNLAWGNWLLRVVAKEESPFFSFRAFWLGWVGLLAFLQLWHLFLPITPITLVVALIIGAVINLRQLPRWWQSRPPVSFHPFSVIFLLLLFLVADYALRPFVFFDNGLYHLATLKWLTTYAIVPGLGNLNGAMGYASNQVYFLWIALFEIPCLGLRGYSLANGLLMLVLTWEGIHALITIVTTRRFAPADVLFAVLLVPLINLTFVSFYHYPASPNPDYVTMLLSFKLGVELLRLLTGETPRYGDALMVLAVAIALPLTKLSGAVYGGVVFLITVGCLWQRAGVSHRKVLITVVGLVLVLVLPWVVRNVILTGYLVYPSSLALPVPWRVSEAQALDDTNWVRSWARRPDVTMHWFEVLGNWEWLESWRVGFWEPQGMRPGVYLMIAGWSGALLFSLLHRRLPSIWKVLGVWAIAGVAELLFWFFSAPAPRFAIGYFWLLAAGGIVAWVESAPWISTIATRVLRHDSLIVAVTGGLMWFVLVSHGPLYSDDFAPIPQPVLTTHTLQPDLQVWVPAPEEQGQCWDTPLPCAPFPNINLHLREDGNLGAGFTVEP